MKNLLSKFFSAVLTKVNPFLLVLGILFFYTCIKTFQLIPNGSAWIILIPIAVFAFMMAPLFVVRSVPRLFEASWFTFITWISHLLIGVWTTFIVISIPLDLIDWVYAFTTQNICIGVLLVSTGVSALGFLTVLLGPKVVTVKIPIQAPTHFKELTIAQISDLHIGPTIRTRYVQKVIKKVNELTPDLIVFTGDLVDAPTKSIESQLRLFGQLKARHGIFYVTGNHEYYWGVRPLLRELETLNFKILLNTNNVVDVNGAKILIAGITDQTSGHFEADHHFNISAAKGTQIVSDFKILLAHRPDDYQEAEALGFDLQLSGHTHGGQFFPFSLFIPLAHRYYRGLQRHGEMWLYVNRGTGYWGPPNRFGVPAEITFFRLQTSQLEK